jgi:hypothetical protein
MFSMSSKFVANCFLLVSSFSTYIEIRVENQEQYSRRTSLRFHNIKVPVDQRGTIIHPVDTDDLVLQVCNTKLTFNSFNKGFNVTVNT